MSHFSCSFLKVNQLLQCFHPLNLRQVFGHSGIIKTLGHWKTWDCKPSFQFKEVTPVAHLWTLEGFEDVKNLLMITIVVELICHFLLGCMDWISFMWPNMWSTREAWDLCTSGSAKQCPAFPPPAMAVSSFSNNGPQPEHPPGCGASQKAGTWFQGRFVIPIVQDVQEYITECFPMVSMDSGPVDSNSPVNDNALFSALFEGRLFGPHHGHCLFFHRIIPQNLPKRIAEVLRYIWYITCLYILKIMLNKPNNFAPFY